MGVEKVRKLVPLSAELWQLVSDYRFEQKLRTEGEAVNQLLEAGLEAKGMKTEATAST